jgi:CheY-like chemotaxis protein
VLVVDNEETDRDLLASVLAPLGFDVRQAASGEECLALLRRREADWQPDAIFMDLAMPGIDGWETLRRIRREALGPAALAIVSANAFDKGLDNDVGIAASDFITKPVRVPELLDWLGRALGLEWTTASNVPAPVAAPAPTAALVLPEAPHLRALQELVDLGYVRGIVKRLDQIEAESPACAAFVARMRAMAREFRLDEMNGVIRQALG